MATSCPNPDEPDDEIAAVTEFLRDITPAGANLTVIKTAIGAAQRVALALDRSDWPEVIGNIRWRRHCFRRNGVCSVPENSDFQDRACSRLRRELRPAHSY